MTRSRWMLLAVLATALLAFFVFDLGRFLSLDELRARQAEFAALYAQHPLQVMAAYFVLYVLVTALSLPGAAIMTLAGGAVFGLVVGTLLVSFASSLGATLAFLVARHLLREPVRARFGARVAEIDRGIAKEGGFYLFTLRLVPLVPFFVINLVMGLTAMRTLTFYAVSQLGMLAGTLVYVNAGTQLARLDSPAGILSPALIGSFVLLGLFPLAAKRVVDAVRARRVYARWAHAKPRRYDRNLVVIGAGAAGLVTSYIAAAVKARVTLVESHKMGGDCLNYGCVPSKALIRTATLARELRDAAHYGLDAAPPTVDFARVMERVAQVVRDIEPHDSVERYTGLGVEVLAGHARLVDPWTVEVRLGDGSLQRLSTRAIVLATGAEPFVPPLPGLAEAGVLTSDTLWGLRELPRRLLVLGGGPIGCELAQAFARLGAQVTLVEQAPRLMVREDEEVSALVRASLERDGVAVRLGTRALRCVPGGGAQQLVVEHEGTEQALGFDRILCAVGRVARLRGYGLEELGIPSGRTIETNAYLETLYPNIYAAGDVAGPYQFTHTASHQAWYAVVNALFGHWRRFKADYSVIPWCTFVDPEVARVGLNEQEARAQGVAYELTRFELGELDRAIAEGATQGFVKVLTPPGSDRILGVTLVGAHAGELIAEWVLAMRHGLGLNKLLGTIHVYPTLAEANKYAAGAWKRAHAPQRLLEWVARYHAWRRG
ncbi:FAD-dependent oxidoreductase [Piscinibacter defluvii]|uniref:FAD-dependent oxidoreductase n=1 Tax=Piscinibacter defluvii TaxID=1796922 RepID=UPI000FDCF691|nr:bifunctional TVP38/TMEM64 family protein/FAD-dependent oxidoreductase [Piscinibacter defluvii]